MRYYGFDRRASVASQQETDSRSLQLALEIPAWPQGQRLLPRPRFECMGTHRYHRSTVLSGIHCDPSGKGCANPATLLNKFFPTSPASATGSAPCPAGFAGTSAVEFAGFDAAPRAVCPSEESWDSTDASGSQRIPRVAVEDEVGADGANEAEKEEEEGMKVLRSRKIAEGLAFVRLRGRIELVKNLSPVRFLVSESAPSN